MTVVWGFFQKQRRRSRKKAKERKGHNVAKGSKNIATAVYELIGGPVEELGYILWDVEYVKEGANYYLRVTIDTEKEGGIDILDCEKVHRMLDPLLDEADPIEGAYYLSVSSPGIERELRLPWHFGRCIGQTVELRLFSAIETDAGKVKHITAKLKGYEEEDGGTVILEDNAGLLARIPRSAVSKAHTVFDFDAK